VVIPARAWLGAWVLFATLGGAAWAESPEEMFERGNTAYEQGRYVEAAQAYESALRYGIRDARVEYNLGNAEFRRGRLGHAILHYERARRLDPTDPDIRGNLDFALAQRFDRVEPPPQLVVGRWIVAVQDQLGPDRQAWGVVGLVWLMAGLIAWCSARPGRWRAAHGWSLASLVVATGLVAASWSVTHERLTGRRSAVVLAESAEVLAGPGPGHAALFTMHEGLIVVIQGEREDWLQVRLPNGYGGWVERQALEPV
jgi:tetratricopeptide (TPR) repeat protein